MLPEIRTYNGPKPHVAGQGKRRSNAAFRIATKYLLDAYVDDSSPYESEGDYSHTVYVNTVLQSDTEPREAV